MLMTKTKTIVNPIEADGAAAVGARHELLAELAALASRCDAEIADARKAVVDAEVVLDAARRRLVDASSAKIRETSMINGKLHKLESLLLSSLDDRQIVAARELLREVEESATGAFRDDGRHELRQRQLAWVRQWRPRLDELSLGETDASRVAAVVAEIESSLPS